MPRAQQKQQKRPEASGRILLFPPGHASRRIQHHCRVALSLEPPALRPNCMMLLRGANRRSGHSGKRGSLKPRPLTRVDPASRRPTSQSSAHIVSPCLE